MAALAEVSNQQLSMTTGFLALLVIIAVLGAAVVLILFRGRKDPMAPSCAHCSRTLSPGALRQHDGKYRCRKHQHLTPGA